MNSMLKSNKGFTFVEIIVVLALVVLTAAIAIVNLLASRRTVEYNLCINNLAVIEHAEGAYYHHARIHSESIYDLVDKGYLSKVPICASGGGYAWVPYDSDDPSYQTEVGCSFHMNGGTKLTLSQIYKAINAKYSERYAQLLAEIKARYVILANKIKEENLPEKSQLLKADTKLKRAEIKAMRIENNLLKNVEKKQAKANY